MAFCDGTHEETRRSTSKCVSLRLSLKILFGKGFRWLSPVLTSGLPALLAVSAVVGWVEVQVVLGLVAS
jgi:hypothetical protein